MECVMPTEITSRSELDIKNESEKEGDSRASPKRIQFALRFHKVPTTTYHYHFFREEKGILDEF